MLLTAMTVRAQIKIAGNVYGGGNAGDTDGSTTVTVRAGDLNEVYGGARMADVTGSTFVNIDGEHASDHILITSVYGGNDIAGRIGVDSDIDDTWNAKVHTSRSTKEENGQTKEDKVIVIGSLFGGGNGDYDYTSDNSLYKGMPKPELARTWLDIHGGCIAHLYGGGNNATVTRKTLISIDNASDVLQSAIGREDFPFTPAQLQEKVHLSSIPGTLTNYAFNFARVFGGNNKAEMKIRPTWDLQDGVIRDLYSGGNQGAMTSPEGLLLEIKANSEIEVDNVYGGCRMADVCPKVEGVYTPTSGSIFSDYNFPDGFSARVVISGGDITNVYGGNDISGKVYGGNAIGIRHSVRGDVYGGGNGSYPYTDNDKLKDDPTYGDFYYNPGESSVESLNAFRPNAEAVSIRIAGTQANPVFIGGSVYCGGNSATLRNDDSQQDASAELKIGSYVYADKVFLGNNGENMVKESILKQYAGDVTVTDSEGQSHTYDFSQINLTSEEKDPADGQTQFDKYMDGVAMMIKPKVSPDNVEEYKSYTSYIGSFYCGGNVGSMKMDGLTTIDFDYKLIIFDKLVGGCNNAFVPVKYDDGAPLNVPSYGGLLGTPDGDGNKLVLNLSGLKIQPKRWKDENDKRQLLEWNIVDNRSGAEIHEGQVPALVYDTGQSSKTADEDDMNRRFEGGNIYGGCYTSGIVNGNVVININSTLVDMGKRPDEMAEGEEDPGIFDSLEEDSEGEASLYGTDQTTEPTFHIIKRRTGVILGQQGMDVLGKALNVFGGGKGKDTEIWGSTTINLNQGYIFQIFGGSEEGVIGKPNDGVGEAYLFNGKTYKNNDKYSCYVNLCGTKAGVSKQRDHSESMAECEFMYGGGFFGPICGNTIINLGKGRIFNSFAGSCNADILGHTETYIGRQVKAANKSLMGKLGGAGQLDHESIYEEGFPWVRDITYGGNDLGGRILGSKDFTFRVRQKALDLAYKYDEDNNPKPAQMTANAYTEYLQGRSDAIFGGCYGTYDYTAPKFDEYFYTTGGQGTTEGNLGTPRPGYYKPFLDNAFVNFRPTTDPDKTDNLVNKVYGAGQGIDHDKDKKRDGDKFQNRSYVLVDIPDDLPYYKDAVIFGGGSFNGLGMTYTQAETQPSTGTFDLDKASAIVDLVRGKIHNVYGGSYNEGIVRRTVVNVPDGSTISVDNLFGGGFGRDINIPCDVYEAQVNYHSEAATVNHNIYGGNNSADRTLYSQVNITKPVWQNRTNGYLATVYGAGLGENTWAQYTEVNLLRGAKVYEVYGGGEKGRVFNEETLAKWKEQEGDALDLSLHAYTENGLRNILAHETALGGKYNTNVHIHKGATVVNYAYGGGLGDSNILHSGDVYGTTYIDVLGGTVMKDIYAAGTTGSVQDGYRSKTFTAGSTAYIAGGSVRNVYGGGWKGSVGQHRKIQTDDEGKVTILEEDADIIESADNDIAGETHVVIGIRKDQPSDNLLAAIKKVLGESATLENYGFYAGLPTIQRNAYGGGEGGAVFGKTNLTLNNGYIGYEYNTTNTTTGTFDEKVDDETYYDDETGTDGTGRLRDCGNVFGGGYDARSSVDESNVVMYGGLVRGSLHGGGEIATIGRGSTQENGDANSERIFKEIYREGKTFVDMYNGHVKRNVFGGGKGYNLLGYGSNSNLYTDGYTFGQTEVHIHGGEIGTEEGVKEKGYGNVFGGGDLGYVYSKGYDNSLSRITSTGSPGHTYYYYGEGENSHLTEDCKVVVSPYLQVKEGGTSVRFDGETYGEFDYVPTDYLNTLPKDKNDDGWTNLITEETIDGKKVERGVIIRNAVFGGGNVASNTDTHYANATTVFGNTTATLYDVYHRDFITVGTEHTGGIYGGGNLSMVDGYRELNITNYGTDYYNLQTRISITDYHNLSNRERAYFKLEYECQVEYTDANSKKHIIGEKISEEDYNKLDATEQGNWAQFGFCSIYAGRLLNTIQRADLCGVYGSRMVLQGAKDRVADVGEKIDYTINRVGEVSFNKQISQVSGDTGKDALHGNYFGIYSLVNHLGNLTSDVRFLSNYVDEDEVEHTDETYYSHKEPQPQGPWRNRGTSHNQVALASGVFLELTTENSTADHKDYGYITGIVELDLINVKKEIEGGGFVYAKNEHRLPVFYADMDNMILSEYNSKKAGVRDAAKTYKRYRYSADAIPANATSWPTTGGIVAEVGKEYTYKDIQTSGNFIHAKKRIVDDCYPVNNAYKHDEAPYSEAHYWYIKGSVYVYDQVVSAYTGSATAYSKAVHLPLTITAASHGQLKLLNVKPNRYAYYYKDQDGEGQTVYGKIGTGANAEEAKVWVNRQADSYELNDVITWWDWQNLPEDERDLFVEETYVNAVACQVNGQKYAVGEYVMLPSEKDTFKGNYKAPGSTITITDYEGNELVDKNGDEYTRYTDLSAGKEALFNDVFRSSNNLGHDTGYVLTFDMNTPKIWDDYYTQTVSNGTAKIMASQYQKLLDDAEDEAAQQVIIDTYTEGPTFKPTADKVLGRRHYTEGQILTKAEYDLIDATETASNKQRFMEAYVAKTSVSYTVTVPDPDEPNNPEKATTISKSVTHGTAIPKSEYDAIPAGVKAAFAPALVCTNTVKLATDVYLLHGDLKTASEIAELKTTYASTDAALRREIDDAMTSAYICAKSGEAGGRKYLSSNNYSAIQSWCALPKDDRSYFYFNYDAFDLFADPDYSVETVGGKTTQEAYHSPYSDVVGVEYQAVYKAPTNDAKYSYPAGTTASGVAFAGGTLSDGGSISNEIFEAVVPNYKQYYTKVNTATDVDTNTGKFYIAKTNFIYDGEPYGLGQVVNSDVYQHNRGNVADVTPTLNGIFYYCNQSHLEGNTSVTVGDCIGEDTYTNLRDDQKYFVIKGQEPTETTTLYVNRESDIKDVTKEKVITVVYQYTYYEEDDNHDIKLTNELHVVNVHLQLESGMPIIGPLENPPTVLPGNAVGLKLPDVQPGLYEVLTNGWELFSNSDDADHHRNGVEFINNSTPVYWYQNKDHYIAFYSKTYLGKAYSNYVPLSVANYHDLADVMERHKDNHLYIDRADVDRPCKVYINDYAQLPETDERKDKNGLDELKNLFDLSLLDASTVQRDENGIITTEGRFKDHALLGNYISGTANLEFILRSDIDRTKPTGATEWTEWTPLGDETKCFGGNVHGDGHHVSGLEASLFGELCGSVYNLGVTGSFTTAGVADSGVGFVENCWVKTSATALPDGASKVEAVFGNPSDPENPGCVQIVNCYYSEANDALYVDHTGSARTGGNARKMPDKAFYNGEVAYDLNGFYLGKRYYDGSELSSGNQYQYILANVDGTLPMNNEGSRAATSEAYYPSTFAYYTPQNTLLTPKLGYVEQRFYDGDFRFAGGTVPEEFNIRRQENEVIVENETVTDITWVPIWPDDYLFFGQMLTYGHVEGRAYEDEPSTIAKSGERLPLDNANNRVYRAPAYFRNSNMGVAHFNPYAVFAKTKKDNPSVIAYKDMTAIDFSGHDDRGYEHKEGLQGTTFYPPLLDDDGIIGFQNVDLTRNLLAYTYTATDAATKTTNTVKAALHDYAYAEGTATGSGYVPGKKDYRTVAEWDRYFNYSNMMGHWVQGNATRTAYTASVDHFLVDKEDFNAPIAYRFGNNYRMWYQREPERFVNRTEGWEGISLPFEAEIVTTDVKGELTHFYQGSTTGHEYWLRELDPTGTVKQKKDANGADVVGVYTADFNPLAAGSNEKNYTNTFLWDYYYRKDSYWDKNKDEYQKTYYSTSHTYSDYPYSKAGKPYIIGFPGATYYEFDLSGEWKPAHRVNDQTIVSPGKQFITFASFKGAFIEVSDRQQDGVTESDFTFMPTYLNNPTIPEGKYVYQLDNDGDSFDKKTDANDVAITAFRPYFVGPAKLGSSSRAVEQIVFGQSDTQIGAEEHGDPRKEEINGGLRIWTKKDKIFVESTLSFTEDMRVVTPAGITVATFSVKPGQTVEVQADFSGLYIVHTLDGKYTKKVAVKRE